jgi:hypothetical protein
LKALHEEAQRAHGKISLGQLQIELGKQKEPGKQGKPKWKVSTSTIAGWLNGEIAPSEKKHSTYWALINYLEERTPGPRLRGVEWELLIDKARAESQGHPGGRPPGAARPTRVGPFRYCHNAGWYLPQVLMGRERELAELQGMIRAVPGYLALVAPPWAGKTSFLATFVTSCPTDDIDLVAYFVRWRQGTDASDFLNTMVTELGRHVGRKRPGRADRSTLLDLYVEAARTSLDRGRTLLLVIDGLDEDAGAEIGGHKQSIASLLPQQPYPGLRVLVSRRWHPPLPGDVPLDHPLRKAEQIAGFRPSPQAGVLRSTALNDLAALFRDPRGWVREVIGYLALATGGLSRDNLIELIRIGGHSPTPIQFDLTDLLHNVAGRGLGPADLEPDTFVLAHEELYGAATDQLGPETLAELTRRLHIWADNYRDAGWPASTPGYLLHHYQELLRSTGDLDRCTSFALDHRRLLRLADQGRTDLALASLDHVTQTTPTPSVLVSAAASRSLLDGENPVVPREVLRALVVVGDVVRARSLALSPADPASKAVRLMEVVQVLLPLETPKAGGQSARLAREAAKWAERAQQHQLAAPAAELDTEAIVPRAAVVLAAAGLPDAAIRLLTTVDICLPTHAVPAAEAAALLLESNPSFAARLLDELMLEAESQAESAEGKPVLAVEIWSAVATADPGRAELIHRRMKAFSAELTVETSGLTAVDCCALTASALAAALPDEARKLAKKARCDAWKVLDIAPEDALRESLARTVQALLDVGEPPKKVRSLLAGAPTEITTRAALLLDGSPNEEDMGPKSAEAERAEELLRSMKSLSGLGDGPQLRQTLNRFMKRNSGQSTPPMWLPSLAEALASADEGTREDRALLESAAPDISLVIRVLTSAALAHADAQRHGKALQYAEKAAGMAQHMTSEQPPEVRALVAQAFAHAGDADLAREWAAPPHGRRPSGRTGIPYRRAALAIEMGLNPKAVVARTVTDGLPGVGISTSGNDLLKILRSHAVGTRTEAQVASLETTACARLASEPLIATGLALLRAVFGDTEHAYATLAELPSPADRGVAQATVAAYLAGVPVHLDVAGGEDRWTLSVLRVLAHHMYPKAPDNTLQNLTCETLGTSGWYWILPVLSRTAPEALYRVVDVLDQHRQARGTES